VEWEQFSFTATASTSDTILDCHGVDASGAVLPDNVVVTAQSAAPEPFSMVLAGSGLEIIGLVRGARRTQR
jgi:hypothetical protein